MRRIRLQRMKHQLNKVVLDRMCLCLFKQVKNETGLLKQMYSFGPKRGSAHAGLHALALYYVKVLQTS